jgi:hypothetical protein
MATTVPSSSSNAPCQVIRPLKYLFFVWSHLANCSSFLSQKRFYARKFLECKTRVRWVSYKRPLKNALLTGFWGPKRTGRYVLDIFWRWSRRSRRKKKGVGSQKNPDSSSPCSLRMFRVVLAALAASSTLSKKSVWSCRFRTFLPTKTFARKQQGSPLRPSLNSVTEFSAVLAALAHKPVCTRPS